MRGEVRPTERGQPHEEPCNAEVPKVRPSQISYNKTKQDYSSAQELRCPVKRVVNFGSCCKTRGVFFPIFTLRVRSASSADKTYHSRHEIQRQIKGPGT